MCDYIMSQIDHGEGNGCCHSQMLLNISLLYPYNVITECVRSYPIRYEVLYHNFGSRLQQDSIHFYKPYRTLNLCLNKKEEDIEEEHSQNTYHRY